MKKLIVIYVLLCVLFFSGIVLLIPKEQHTPHVQQDTIVANTSAFQEGDLVVMTKYGLKKAMASDVCDTLGIVTVVGEDGRLILKYKK